MVFKHINAFFVIDEQGRYFGYEVFPETNINCNEFCFTSDVTRAIIFSSIKEAKSNYEFAERSFLKEIPKSVTVHQLIYSGGSLVQKIK